MDNSGKNRYELLFMDDDAEPAIASVDINAGKKKAPEPNVQKKTTAKHEKENKSATLNKTDANPKSGNAAQNGKVKPAAPVRPKNPVKPGGGGGEQSSSNRPSNGVGNREQRFPRRPYGDRDSHAGGGGGGGGGGGEFGNDLPQRQYRDRENRDNRENRGPPRFRNNEKFGKREFDRQSGSDKTGIKAVDKRDGAGAHNWGSAKQDIDDLNKSGEVAPVNEKDDSATEQTGGGEANTTNNVEEDESKQMTLDEWKALREQRAKPTYNLRKAGDGVDNDEWKKMTVLSKKKETDSADELEYDPSMYPQRVGRLQRIVDIQFNFNDGRRGGGGFRKGGPRGQQPRGPRPEYDNNSNGYEKPQFANKYHGGDKRRAVGPKPLKVDDENQFPTLA